MKFFVATGLAAVVFVGCSDEVADWRSQPAPAVASGLALDGERNIASLVASDQEVADFVAKFRLPGTGPQQTQIAKAEAVVAYMSARPPMK
jgi:hypothetical protein